MTSNLDTWINEKYDLKNIASYIPPIKIGKVAKVYGMQSDKS
jgi:hypothetical protein